MSLVNEAPAGKGKIGVIHSSKHLFINIGNVLLKNISKALVVCFLAVPVHAIAQNYKMPEFVQVTINKDSLRASLANSYTDEISVRIVANELKISKYHSSFGIALKTPNGRFLAMNISELGCDLLYKPNDAKLKTFYYNGHADSLRDWRGMAHLTFKNDPSIKLLQGHQYGGIHCNTVVALFKFKDDVYMVENIEGETKYPAVGKPVVTINHCELSRLTLDVNVFKKTKVLEISDPALALTTYGTRYTWPQQAAFTK
ncbi:MAG: hypothetical protein ABIN91_14045 [Mucilaginibacter sp.]|uniref:hypothetical protein n=1 Tax=Mucilaginibacter sp. TaxID=1882438 RepID=UPI0032652C6F